MPLRIRCVLFFALPAALRIAATRYGRTQERDQAAREVTQLAEVLALKPGMIVADVGAGGGAMSVVLAKWLGPRGRVYATDIRPEQLAEIRAYVSQDALSNVVVIEGAESSTNLPSECCDAIFLRDVYHHLTRPHEFNTSLLTSLEPDGRLAIIDFLPDQGSSTPAGVPADRGGHGISASMIVTEVTRAGFRHLRTLPRWPPDDDRNRLFLVMFEKP